MQRFLVTGASGFVGRALCRELITRGYLVRAALRTAKDEKYLPKGCEIAVIGEIGAATTWATVVKEIDVIVHLAARVHVMRETATDPLQAFREVNVAGTARLAREATSSAVKRLVYVSSIKVNGESTEASLFSEADLPSPQDFYGLSKCEAETALRRVAQETDLEVVIVRPPLVYGPAVKGNFLRLLKLVSWGLPLPLASVNNLRSMLYLGNFVDVLTLCAQHPGAAGKTFLVSDGEDISTPQLIRKIADLMGRPCRLWSLPPSLLKLASKMVLKSAEVERLIGSLQVDSAQIRRELEWTPPYTLDQGLAETVRWFNVSRPA